MAQQISFGVETAESIFLSESTNNKEVTQNFINFGFSHIAVVDAPMCQERIFSIWAFSNEAFIKKLVAESVVPLKFVK